MPLEDSSIPARFQAVAAQFPEREAIGSGSWRPSYAELHAASSSLAETLRGRSEPRSRVALLQSLDGYLIGSILGALGAEQPVAVFNPSDPPARLRQNLADLEPALIVSDPTNRELALQAAPAGVPVIDFAEAIRAPAPRISGNSASPGDLAFLIHTSGSTGRPKWVVQTHRNLLHNFHRHNSEMRIQPEDRVLLLASPSGSQAIATILCALLSGAAICPFPVAEKGIIGLAEWIQRHEITVYVSAASALRHFLRTLPPGERMTQIRLVKVGAEAVLASDLTNAAKHFSEECVYYCTYSCAEAGNMMQLRVSGDEVWPQARLPLGKPAEGIEIFLRGDRDQPVPDGEAGEIVVRSHFLSPGYWHNDGLTAERFPGGHDYRTGDLGKREPDGSLYCVGRVDDVVKIRGNTVAVQEVERAIAALPGVREAAVCVRRQADGSLSLAAFVAGHWERASIREALLPLLPAYMLPAEIIVLERLPLSAHGKIDREALLSRAVDEPTPLPPGPASTDTEALLLRIWQESFGEASVTRESNFFELGGDSLSAGVVAAKVHGSVAVELNMLDFAQHPSLHELASRIDQLRGPAQVPAVIERAPGRSRYPLSFTQEGIWKHCRDSPKSNRAYSVARSFGLRGPLDVAALREAMSWLLRRNEILRTRFSLVDGDPAQIVEPPAPAELPLIDLSAYGDARERAVALLQEEAARPLDLDRGPLHRVTLVRIAPEEHWLLRLSHHILYDRWSWKLYFDQLGSAYESIRLGVTPAWSSEELQYGDYALWERRMYSAGSGARARLVDWWKTVLAHQPNRLGIPFPHRSLSPARVKASDGQQWSDLDDAVRSSLAQLARAESTTHYVIGLAAFAALLPTWTGRKHLLVGTHMTNRVSSATQGIQGNFASLALVCLEWRHAASFLDWMSLVRKRVVEAQAHAQIPREEIWQDLRVQGVEPPEIEVIFGAPGWILPPKFGELELTAHTHRFDGLAAHGSAAMPWGFTLNFELNRPEKPCEVNFDARLHNPAKVRRFLRSYVRLLSEISSDPSQAMGRMVRKARGWMR